MNLLINGKSAYQVGRQLMSAVGLRPDALPATYHKGAKDVTPKEYRKCLTCSSSFELTSARRRNDVRYCKGCKPVKHKIKCSKKGCNTLLYRGKCRKCKNAN